jgi:phage-related protein
MLYNIIVLLGLSSSLAATGYGAYTYFDPLKWIGNWIKTLPGKVKRFFMWILEEIFKALKELWKMIQSIGGKIKKAGENVIRKLKDGLKKMIRAISNGAKKAIKTIERGGKKVIRDIDRGGKKVIRTIGGAVTKVTRDISGAGRKMVNEIGRTGEKIFNDIKRKVNQAIRKVGQIAGAAFRKFKELFNKAFEEIRRAAYAVRDAALAAARAAREAAEAAARAAREAAQAAAREAKRVADAARNFFCFSGNTPIKLIDGETVPLKYIKLGDTLINGAIVQATMQIKSSEEDPFYKIYSEELEENVFVTGSHHIKCGDKYILVRDFEKAEKLDTVDDILHCLVTSDHTIPVGEFTFWDWEDNLL